MLFRLLLWQLLLNRHWHFLLVLWLLNLRILFQNWRLPSFKLGRLDKHLILLFSFLHNIDVIGIFWNLLLLGSLSGVASLQRPRHRKKIARVLIVMTCVVIHEL
jgi:hypothetical protein